MKTTFLYISIFFLAAACGGDDFKKVEELGEFRILAVLNTSSTTEVAPGGSVNLQLFVSDVKSGNRIITGTTVACIDPGIAFGAEVKCDHDPLAVTDTYSVDTTTADMAANLFTGLAADTLNVTVPASIFVGRSARDQFNGVGYIIIFNFEVDGRSITAFKRVLATNKAVLNTNPVGSAILLNGAAIGTELSKDDQLTVTSSSQETYDYISTEGTTETLTEEFQIAWFVSEGKFDKPKSDLAETVKYLGDTPIASSLVIAVVRDERGGVEVVRQLLP